MKEVPFIRTEDVAGRLSWTAIADAIAEAHRAAPPALGDLFLTQGTDTLLTRAAWVEGLGAGVKSVTVMPGNVELKRPSVQGAMLIFGTDGAIEAVVDSEVVTYWKTAADSLLGARLLARPNSRRLLVVGAGAVAGSLVEAYRSGFPGIDAAVWNRNGERARALADDSGIEVATDLPIAVDEADIIATATMARDPVLLGKWLRPGQHVDLVGAFRADMREADDAALRRAEIFVDSRETTIDHIGELKDPIARGVITRADVRGDLRDLIAGDAGRSGPEAITLYKNGGGAHLDLMTARAILAALKVG